MHSGLLRVKRLSYGFLLTSNDSSFNEQLSRIFIRAVENQATGPFPGKKSQARSTKPKLLKAQHCTPFDGRNDRLGILMQATSTFLYPKRHEG
jgi:hypothetical protein